MNRKFFLINSSSILNDGLKRRHTHLNKSFETRPHAFHDDLNAAPQAFKRDF